MTWRHEPVAIIGSTMDRYFIDELLVYCEIFQCYEQWFAMLRYGKLGTIDIMGGKRFDTAEEAMTAVEERLASFARDLLSDALGIRRTQETK